MAPKEREHPKITREAVASDSVLAQLLVTAGESLGKLGLTRLLQAQQRFNEPVLISEENRTDNFFKLKSVLEEIPDYVELAQSAGLSPQQSEDTLIQLFDSQPYDFHDHGETIHLLNKLFQSMSKMNTTFDATSYTHFSPFIDTCSKEGIIDAGFFGVSALVEQGVGPVPAMRTVKYLVDEDGSLGGYTTGPFLDLLRATPRSGIPPETLLKTLDAIGGERPYYHRGAYTYFQEALAFGCPLAGVTPTEMLEAYYSTQNPEKDIVKFISNYLGDTENRLTQQNGLVVITDQDKDHYFIPTNGPLEHSANPYQTKRSLTEGLHDLARLASVNLDWNSLSQGMFIFNPHKGIWYSLGGMTKLEPRRVIHNVIYYDLGQLSDNPLIFVVHPKGFESWITPFFEENSVLDEYRRQIGTFLGGTPGRGEYTYLAHSIANATKPVTARYIIVHSAGMTELNYPSNVDELEALGTTGRQIRDEALLRMDWPALVRKYGHDAGTEIVFSSLLKEFNNQLPEGFRLTYYPTVNSFKQHALSKE